MFEIYKGRTEKQNRKKTYLVDEPGTSYISMCEAAKKFFRCSEAHIDFTCGYLYKGELYLDDPKKTGAKYVGVAYYV